MDYPLWGREDDLRRVINEITTTPASILVEIVAPDGAGSGRFLAELEERLEAQGLVVHRASADPLNEFAPGSIADELGALPEGMERQALMVVDAQLADATSLGIISRRLVDVPGTVAVIDHAPADEHRRLLFDSLRRTAARHGTTILLEFGQIDAAAVAAALDVEHETADLILRAAGGTDEGLVGIVDRLAGGSGEGLESLDEVLGELATSGAPLRGLGDDERRLVELAAIADRPLAIATAAGVLGNSESAVLDIGDRLVRSGHLRESREGYGPVPEPLRSAVRNGLGEARRAHLFAAMARTLETLEGDGNEALIGTLYRRAGRWAEALPHLTAAGLALFDAAQPAEAFPLVDGALAAIDAGALIEPETHARLLLARARHLRDAGFSEEATDDLEKAVRLAAGATRIDALGYLAALHDDQQRPQTAETIIATAEWEAARHELPEKLGSLHTFRSLALERLGFGREADRLIEIGQMRVANHGSERQQYNAKSNRAWIAFDRGEVGLAELLFEELAAAAEENDDPAAEANQLAWLARARFGTGNPQGALAAIERANRLADVHGLTAVRFLTAIALAEGGSEYGRPDLALEAVDEEQSIVSLQLQAWQNGTHYRRAMALQAAGRREEAGVSIADAVESSPPGANGARWRLRAQAARQVLERNGDEWDRPSAENLTDELLVANWFGAAVDLMVARAGIEGDRELGLDAAALAMQLGNPMAAARAIQAAAAWDDPSAGPVAERIKAIAPLLPSDWAEPWERLPHVAAALALEPPVTEAPEAQARVLEALDAAGLANPDTILSPAQRRAGGLVRRRPAPRRRLGWVAIAAIIGGVALVGALGGALFNAIAGEDETPATTVAQATTTTAAATTTTTLPLEEREIAAPERLAGQHQYRGGPELAGITTATGIPSADGHYWRVETTEAFRSSPTVRGALVYVGGGDGELHRIDIVSGQDSSVTMTDRIDGPILVEEVSLGGPTGSGTEPITYAVDRAGEILALRSTGFELGRTRVDGPVSAGPVLAGDVIIVASGAGRIHALTTDLSSEAWRFPSEGTAGPFTTTPTLAGEFVYAASDDGTVYVLDTASGIEQCSYELPETTSAPIVVAEGRAWIPTGNSGIQVLAAGTCAPPAQPPLIVNTGARITVAPIITEDTIYVASGMLMTALSLPDLQTERWSVATEDLIESSPVLAGGVLYFGSNDGYLYAVDVASGEQLWRYPTAGAIKTSPAVIDGAVIVTNNRGEIIAVAAES